MASRSRLHPPPELRPTKSESQDVGSIADSISNIESRLDKAWLPLIYRERILKMRTRSYDFPAITKNPAPEIHHTLLGIELKVGRRRMLCPDLPTARYLAVFARIGAKTIAVPYDITRISYTADELESSWHRMLLMADDVAAGRSEAFRARLVRQLIGKVRDELEAAGAGPRIPEFKKSTKQRVRPDQDQTLED